MFDFYRSILPNIRRSIPPDRRWLVRHHGRPRPEQMKDDDNRPAYTFGGLKLPWGTVMLILVLTLAVWLFFYLEGMELDPGSTCVVALLVTIPVALGRWLLTRGQQKGAAK